MLHFLPTILQAQVAFGAWEPSPSGTERSYYFHLAARMIESNVQRGQLNPSNASSAFIEQGIFQNALREAIAATHDEQQAERWRGYLSTSIDNLTANLTNSTLDSELPLDRFSVGSSMLLQHNATSNASLLPAIGALRESLALQPRNADSGLWYYNNVANVSAYQNLSYVDGMFSYPLFALLLAAEDEKAEPTTGCNDIYEQFRLLYMHCGQPSGLLSHGYDAIKNHSWANPVTGASPVVWGRALSWYSLGLLNVLQNPALSVCSPDAKIQLQQLLQDVLEPQLTAAEKSRAYGGAIFGVWQVLDRPWKPGNFVEASASFMTVYTLLRSAMLGLLPEFKSGRLSVTELATGIFFNDLRMFVDDFANGTVSLNGTSTVASLRDDVVDYKYYVSRPTATNSLLGTSAFILACLEVARDEEQRWQDVRVHGEAGV